MALVPVEDIERRIYLIRDQKVILSTDLAKLYGVATKVFNQAVKRNKDRFPADFMFRLSEREAAALRSQIVTLDRGRGRYPKYAPYAFTEQGVAMLSSVLRSRRAIQVNMAIMRVFVRLREILATHKDLAKTGDLGAQVRGARREDSGDLRGDQETAGAAKGAQAQADRLRGPQAASVTQGSRRRHSPRGPVAGVGERWRDPAAEQPARENGVAGCLQLH